MGKIIFGINLTLDGCCDHTKGIADEELHEHYAQQLREAGVLLYGRKTYELMVPFWPDIAKSNSETKQSMKNFAQAFDSVGKIVVVSRTLEQIENNKTSIIRDNLRDEVLRLKQETDGNISTGGVDIPSQLMELDLIDEYRIVVHPVIAGAGRRLFDSATPPDKLQLKLVETKVFKSGSIALRYVKA